MKAMREMEALLRQRGLLKKVIRGKEQWAADEKVQGSAGEEALAWLTCDSRAVVPGTLFICKGAAFRPEYLQEAVKRGCVAYLSDHVIETEGSSVTGLIVNDIRKAMAAVSAAFFGYEPGRPVLTGITGTKGKTTTAWYLKGMLDEYAREHGKPETGLISTVENYDGKSREDAVMTTPEAPQLHELLANAQEAGLPYVTMEVSSQALKYKRVRELTFQVGIFLNISEDHISPQEHQDFEDYFSSKLSIFRQTETACVNLDSDYAQRIVKAARKAQRVVTFGRNPKADIRCSEVKMSEEGISFLVTCDRFTERFTLAMRGKFNVENAMAAIAAAYVYDIPVHCVRAALAKTRVPGRMETFMSRDRKICGIVDFAHNRLSFERLFDAAFQEYSQYGKIISVFGCPGGKALNRRRELGLIAGLFSDYVYVTQDDPGTECQEKIAEEIRGFVEMTGCPCEAIAEREDALRRAVDTAKTYGEKTLILLLGRGSEKYQKVGTRSLEYPMDAELMRRVLAEED